VTLSKLIPLIAMVLMLSVLVSSSAAKTPERRIALVIGIGAYKAAPTLPNPPKDAHAMALTLAKVGFDVDERLDVDFRDFQRSLREFGIKAQNADVAVFYFAGHGMQVDRENYLVPADAKLEREHDLLYEAMRLDLVLGEASQARTLGIVILDACRNNPFIAHLSQQIARSTRAVDVGVGLARIDDPPKGTLVAMATRADAVAEDGDGEHSPYTQALLANLQTPGIELGLFFRKVRDAVLSATRGRQEPYTFGSLGAEPFFFFPEPPKTPPSVPALAPIELLDNAGAKTLGITGIRATDGKALVARVTGLPKGGILRLGDRLLLIGDTLTLDQLGKVSFTPDGSFAGQAGPFTFDVASESDATNAVPASLFIKILPSNHPPQVEGERKLTAMSNGLAIHPPTDPDNDPLTIIVTEVPTHGVIRNEAGEGLKIGDHLDSAGLAHLTYDPGQSPTGDVGGFAYLVDDGRGGKATGQVHVSVAEGPTAVAMASPKKAEIAQVAVSTPSAPLPPPPKPPAQPAVSLPAAPPAPAADGRDCAQCPALAELPAATFTMGAASGDSSERPAHAVTLVHGFAIAKAPVTVAEWHACVAAGACKVVSELDQAAADSPARNLSWDDAQDYVGWLSKLSGKSYRLPTEAEWEYAARGGTTTTYWWGEKLEPGKANCQDCGTPYHKEAPEPISTFPANSFGLSGMAGGVAQWVADCWFPSYAGAPKDGSARDKKDCHQRVLRGGSWRNDHSYAASSSRFFYEPTVRYLANGMRVARDMP
jgi:formylglycine-generating enzyme required for sulfatase activity/uncharacterized caspase-like protein